VQDRKGHDLRYSINCEKIERELGYQPQVKFQEGLASTIDWYRNNRDWWEPLKERNEIA
jgi:dTDP-glucose 4,6-dehydratase